MAVSLRKKRDSNPQKRKEVNRKILSKKSILQNNKYILLVSSLLILGFYFSWNIYYEDDAANKSNISSKPKHQKAKVKRQSVPDKNKGHADVHSNVFSPSFCSGLSMRNISIDGLNMNVQELYKSNGSSVQLYQIDNFLSDKECDGLSAAHLRFIEKSNKIGPLICFSGIISFQKYLVDAGVTYTVTPKDFAPETTCINSTFSRQLQDKLKYSYSTAFYPGESKFTSVFERRFEKVSGLPSTHGGKFQITSYPQRIGYKRHTDCDLDSTELRDRYATALVYLQNVREGGETVFSKLGVSVTPRKGRLIVWTNMNKQGKCDKTSVHEAAPVIKGRKYILQRWYYFKNFMALGKRPMEPDLPKRKFLQPKISCDYYEQGSCRWYDEWGYDHLVEYNNIKQGLA
ncbi:uncharacterized protein LOC130621441 [Hydractinia symbiolongicarpus]|uniref:uncharacterized protein LOC130621441 n=1 Tax=Hydractinia symbiolongicarpus TaxID=13093 RepID=UPI00254A5BA6|nr:uncharacterized protein LOC130621441 [Hydractinia symbiolongicarpus]